MFASWYIIDRLHHAPIAWLAMKLEESSSLRGRCAMSALFDLEDLLDHETPQTETRQGRREKRRWKAKKRKKNQLNRRRMQPSKKASSRMSNRGQVQSSTESVKQRWSEEIFGHVAKAIVLAVCDIERCLGETWFASQEDMINSLARDHLVVSRRRPTGSIASPREVEVIKGALAYCEYKRFLDIEVEDGEWHLELLINDLSLADCDCETHRLRLAA